MLTWMVSVASMVRKLVYEREIQLEEVSSLGEGTGQRLGVAGYPVCLAGSHCPRRLVHLEAAYLPELYGCHTWFTHREEAKLQMVP